MLKSVARWTVVVSMTACWPRARAAAAAGIMMHSPRRIRVSFRSAPPTMRTAFIARVAFSRPMPTLAPTPPQLFRRQRRSPGSQACCRIGRARHTRCAVGKHASEMEEATGTAATVRSPGSPYVAVLAPSLTEGGDDSRRKTNIARCKRLAAKLGVPMVPISEEGQDKPGESTRFTLLYDEKGRLGLGQPGSGFTPLVVDFCAGKTGHRAKHQKGMEQVVKAAALAKPKRKRQSDPPAPAANTMVPNSDASADDTVHGQSSGVDGRHDEEVETPILWDLTAGLGTDAFLLASAGWTVKMFERSPVVAALLQDALDRARNSGDEVARAAASRMTLVIGDSTSEGVRANAAVGAALATAASAAHRPVGAAMDVGSLTTGERDETNDARHDVGAPLEAHRRPDVVYLDPMFPHRKKSALVKKGMQMLQALLEMEERGDDEEVHVEGGEDDSGEGQRRRQHPDNAAKDEERQLFETAMSLATRKVVVKRPVNGAAIVEHVRPSHTVLSKNGRFDVYAVR